MIQYHEEARSSLSIQYKDSTMIGKTGDIEMPVRRKITTEATVEDKKIEQSLRPQMTSRRQNSEEMRSTMFFFTALRDWERRRWQESLPMRWERI